MLYIITSILYINKIICTYILIYSIIVYVNCKLVYNTYYTYNNLGLVNIFVLTSIS